MATYQLYWLRSMATMMTHITSLSYSFMALPLRASKGANDAQVTQIYAQDGSIRAHATCSLHSRHSKLIALPTLRADVATLGMCPWNHWEAAATTTLR